MPDMRAGAVELVRRRDHRKHDAEIAPRARAQHGAQLRAQQRGTVEADSDGAPPQRRIALL